MYIYPYRFFMGFSVKGGGARSSKKKQNIQTMAWKWLKKNPDFPRDVEFFHFDDPI